jgi:hypothetical protein
VGGENGGRSGIDRCSDLQLLNPIGIFSRKIEVVGYFFFALFLAAFFFAGTMIHLQSFAW